MTSSLYAYSDVAEANRNKPVGDKYESIYRANFDHEIPRCKSDSDVSEICQANAQLAQRLKNAAENSNGAQTFDSLKMAVQIKYPECAVASLNEALSHPKTNESKRQIEADVIARKIGCLKESVATVLESSN